MENAELAPLPVKFDDLSTFALEHTALARECSVKAVEHAWHAGSAYAKIKGSIGHGNWLAWCEKNGIGRVTARDWMDIAEGIKLQACLRFGSIREAKRALPPKRAATGKTDTPVSDLDNAVPFGEGPDDAELLSGFRAKLSALDGLLLQRVQGIWRTGESLSAVKRALPTGTAFDAFLDAKGVPAGQADFSISLSDRHDFDTLARLDAYSIVKQWEGALSEV